MATYAASRSVEATGQYSTTWMAIIVHSAQSVYLSFLILGVVLGLA
jgi:hypothetical protein